MKLNLLVMKLMMRNLRLLEDILHLNNERKNRIKVVRLIHRS